MLLAVGAGLLERRIELRCGALAVPAQERCWSGLPQSQSTSNTVESQTCFLVIVTVSRIGNAGCVSTSGQTGCGFFGGGGAGGHGGQGAGGWSHCVPDVFVKQNVRPLCEGQGCGAGSQLGC